MFTTEEMNDKMKKEAEKTILNPSRARKEAHMIKHKKTVGIYTLGCKVNQYESEAIAEKFTAEGFDVTPHELPCDIYVINTCTVTAESDRKARQFIRRAISSNPEAFVLVTGCMAQSNPEKAAAIAGVDYICGSANKLSVVDAAKRLVKTGKKNDAAEVAVGHLDGAKFETMTISRFDRTRAYLKIEDGCENHCSYCAIPAARGRVRSKCPEDVLSEVRRLTENGCREIVLTGIETASYGRDLENYDLASLLSDADKIDGVGRIRIGSIDPSVMRRAFVDKIACLKHLTPHFHLSMQSGSDRILALMKRKYNTSMAYENIEYLRSKIPGVMVTTDIIVGFPGETDEDFEQTMDFAERVRFLDMHVFAYSRRAGTAADKMPEQIPESIKRERSSRLIALRKKIKNEVLSEFATECPETEVLFESYEGGRAYGHTASFVEVAVPSERGLHSELHLVRIESVSDGICVGRLEDM